MLRKENEFQLDRDGGREKITRAMYSPQPYRRENSSPSSGKKWSMLGAILIGLIVAFIVQHYTS